MAYTKQNFADGQVLEAEHLNKMEQGISDVSKHFVVSGGDTLTWDGNTEGLEVFDAFGFPTYKVTDVSITLNELSNGGSIIYSDADESNVTLEFPSDRLQVVDATEELGVGMYMLYFNNAAPIGFIFPENCEVSGEGETITINKGVYLSGDVETYIFVSSLTIPGYTGFTTEKIDQKVLPGSVILYIGLTDVYLHNTTDTTSSENRTTRDELLNLLKDGRIKCIYLADLAIYSVVNHVYDATDYAEVCISVGTTSDSQNNKVPVVAKMYTAEYTA